MADQEADDGMIDITRSMTMRQLNIIGHIRLDMRCGCLSGKHYIFRHIFLANQLPYEVQ
jgi:hypothetical protein